MKIFILRHAVAEGKSAKLYPDDALRPLSSDGKKRMRQIAKGMKFLNIDFDCLLSSPYLRARQTAEILRDVYKANMKIQYSDGLAAEASCQEFIRELKQKWSKFSRLLIVGHEPFLSHFISVALSGESLIAMELKKGGLCKMEWNLDENNKRGTLRWLMTSKQLRAIAK